MNLLGFFRRVLALVEKREDLSFVMYSRPECPLCETAWHELSRAQQRYCFRLEKRDVDGDPQLKAAHGDSVPVVTVNGKVRFRGSVNPVLLRRLLEARPGRASRRKPDV